MSEHSLTFDCTAHSLDAVQRAAYRFSDRISCDVSDGAETINVTVHIPKEGATPNEILADFRNEVLDQVLRERIRAETGDIRNLVLALAFSKTGLAGSDV